MIARSVHLKFMRLALAQARIAARRGEVPVGAVIVQNGRVIARGHNEIVSRHDPSAHAELLAIQRAAKTLKNERLSGCILYATLEPCPMCAGAITLARLDQVVFGARAPAGKRPNHRSMAIGPIMPRACGDELKRFFKQRR